MASEIFFPLRSNAKSLLGGAPAHSVRKRLKLAALLHDAVLIEDGAWRGNAGPNGSFVQKYPLTTPEEEKWQSAQERHVAEGREFYLAMKPSSAPNSQPARIVLQSPSSIAWRATFAPFKTELRKAYPWVQFGYIDEMQVKKQIAETWISADKRDQRLKELLPEIFVRHMVINNANYDLVIGAQHGVAVSMEKLHATIVRARLERGDAQLVLGNKALNILVPNAAELGWDEIDDLREHRDIRYLRDMLRDIEAAAWEGTASAEDFEKSVHRAYDEQLRAANKRVAEGFQGQLINAVVGLCIGELAGLALGQIPVVPGVLSGTAGLALAHALSQFRRPRWLAADAALRQAVKEKRLSQPGR